MKIYMLAISLLLSSCINHSASEPPKVKVSFQGGGSNSAFVTLSDLRSESDIQDSYNSTNLDEEPLVAIIYSDNLPVLLEIKELDKLYLYCEGKYGKEIHSSMVLYEPCVVTTSTRTQILPKALSLVSEHYFHAFEAGGEEAERFYAKHKDRAPAEISNAINYWAQLLHNEFEYQEVRDVSTFNPLDLPFDVGTTDCKGFTMLAHYFLERQGFQVHPVFTSTTPFVEPNLVEGFGGFNHFALYVPELNEVLDVTIPDMIGLTPEAFSAKPVYDLTTNTYRSIHVSHEWHVEFNEEKNRVKYSVIGEGVSGVLSNYAERIGENDIEVIFHGLNDEPYNLPPAGNYRQSIESTRNKTRMEFSYDITDLHTLDHLSIVIPFTTNPYLVNPVKGKTPLSTCYYGANYTVKAFGVPMMEPNNRIDFYYDEYFEATIMSNELGDVEARLVRVNGLKDTRCDYSKAAAQYKAIEAWESHLNSIGIKLE